MKSKAGVRNPLFPQLKLIMKKFASYIILGQKKDGTYLGYVEHSFSMGLDPNRVRVNRSFEYQYIAKKNNTSERLEAYNGERKIATKMNKKYKAENIIFKVFRVGSKYCPVKIDWREIVLMKKTKKDDKFKWRNLPFKIN